MARDFTAQLSTDLIMDMGYETAYAKSVMFNPVGSVGANIYSSGNVSGFYQSLDICAVGCVNIEGNYQNCRLEHPLGQLEAPKHSMYSGCLTTSAFFTRCFRT